MLEMELQALDAALAKLHDAVATGRSIDTCLRLWSEFVRLRDEGRCVDCHRTRNLAAHHICRKTFLPEARFQTGNGITLCRDCHRELHQGFNGRPDLRLPMDAQNGEKIETLPRLYSILFQDACERGLTSDDYYYLSPSVLAKFKMFQGFEPSDEFAGYRIEQASHIWNACPQDTLKAVLMAALLD
jgi:hypothetical protein